MDNGSGASGSRIADADSPDGDLTGQVIGDFRVLRRLGQGGMGHVYLAEQISLKRKVALKVLKAELAANPTSLQRFKTEAENVARATHANIVQVYASISANGLHYIALEYVEGRNLRDFLTHKGPPDLSLTLSIMMQVASALQRASELGIIHRDIKPENILLKRKGEVKVADFGLARCLSPDQLPVNLTQSGVSMGTPLYMSPEQVEGRPIDPRSDIYSFGVTCYHMLTGQPPYQGATAFAVAMQHVQGDHTPLESIRPDLPAELCAIVKKMMAKEPSQRHQTATELLKDLMRLRETTSGSVSGLQTQPLDLSSPEIAAKPTPTVPIPTSKRRWLPWIVAASLVLALLGGAGIAWLSRSGENSPSSSGLPTSNFETDAIDAMFSPQKREQVLLSAVEMHLNPGTDPQRIRLGLSHCAELGVFYLEQHRLDSAERFFSKLEAHSVRSYRTLGRLGHSLVLAFQDKPEEANAILLDFLRERKPDLNRKELDAMLRQNPRLAQMVAHAQEYNVANANAEHPYPRELEYLRKPPPRRPGADKPATKGN